MTEGLLELIEIRFGTRSRCAKKLGTSRATISRWVKGQRKPTGLYKDVLARGLGIDEETLKQSIEKTRQEKQQNVLAV